MGKSLGLSDALHDYVTTMGLREHPILAELREETARHQWAIMQIAPDQGALMAMLVELMGARRCLEIGVFTGYSALCVAMVLPEDGLLVACDINEEYTATARRYFERAGVSSRVDLRIAPALETLDALLADNQAGTFDFAFVDADKQSYDAYYERCLQLLRPGGLLALDNVLWGGTVVDDNRRDPTTLAIRAINERVRGDDRVSLAMVAIADGITLVRKR